jgi:hypothetical protein
MPGNLLNPSTIRDLNSVFPVVRMSLSHILVIGFAFRALLPVDVPGTEALTRSETGEGRRISLDGAELFIPVGMRYENGAVDVLVHFHGHPATVEREFLASGLPGVLITVNRNGLSAVYAAAFDDPGQFGRILDSALAELGGIDSSSSPLRWRRVRVSSFSAGFGAVREILKDQQNFDRIDALCMADSIYAGYVEGHGDRRVNPEHMVPWRQFARAAADGRKRFLLTHTDLVPGTYASTRETADDLIAAVGTKRHEVAGQQMGPIDVRSRATVNGFEVYGCAGNDGEAHMQHLRHLAPWLRLLNDRPLPPDPADPIVTAINAFEPIWLPGEAHLRDVAVVLHPSGHPASLPEDRAQNQLHFWTAAWLYHLIRHGGGNPVLTRPDLCLVQASVGGGPDAQLAQRCGESRADLLLVFGDAPADEPPASNDTLAQALIAMTKDLPGIKRADEATWLDVPCLAVGFDLEASLSRDLASAQATTPAHRARAEEIAKALVRWADQNRAEIEERRARRTGGEAPQTQPGLFSESRQRHQDKIGQLARSIWMEGPLPPDKAEWFASVFQRVSLSDRTIVYYQPQVRVDEGTVVIGGSTSVPLLVETLKTAFHRVGVDNVRNEMRLLPDVDLDDELFGACRLPTALTRREPGGTAMPQSQLLFGEPVFLLDRQDGELLIQAADGYWGWVPEEAITRMDPDRFGRYVDARQAVLLTDIRHTEMTIPRGARLPFASQAGGAGTLMTPDDDAIEVPSGSVRPMEQAPASEARGLMALQWLNTPYVFGGRSAFGPDCSGLVTNLFEQEGTPIARDAAGQFLSGQLVATGWYRDVIRPGDRLYFINESGKVYHTGLALTATHFIHSAPPAVQISSLRPGDRLYGEEWDRAFLAAKRP